jgi:NADH-quinone oxidoreductase subunit F
MAQIKTLEDLAKIRDEGRKRLYPEKTRIAVGMATCGRSSGAGKVYDEIAAQIERTGLDAILTQTGCIGFCQREPLIDVAVAGGPRVIYERVTPEKADAIVAALAKNEIPSDDVICRIAADYALVIDETVTYPDSGNGLATLPVLEQVPFFGKQVRISLRNCGFIDPDSIEQYIARGGYSALLKVLSEMQSEDVIEEIKKSGLRGRGGAGFPTGTKWEFCRRAEGSPKYIICNADEGDPGAFMDRNILEGDPHAVLEGMMIGAYAIGASAGYIYCRAEYPMALTRLRTAIEQAREHGLLGQGIMGTDFSFDLQIRAGAGAFVCGEETSLIASIEGNVGEPRTRPPFPAQSGLWGKPTNINNVKTWSHVAPIIARGASWYASMGSEKSSGTSVFSLVGKVRNTGLVEVPLGLSLREMIYDIGGGMVDDTEFKAVQTGGPSGGCIPGEFLDTPITYEDLGALGSIMGSGGMIVMNKSTCMVNLARYFISFAQDESCGKCTPCREGTRRMYQILDAICEGKGTPEDVDTLRELAEYVKDTSLCGFGGTIPNPILTTLKYFKDEYDAHVLHRQCPSLACPALSPAPCQSSCPAGIDVPSYVALIAQGKFQEALDVIREDNPFPAVCGYVCTHPCEENCKRRDIDTSVAIKHLKRFVADWETKNGTTGKKGKQIRPDDKVAIVGSGPAGLTAAHFLAMEGYAVTVFEAMEKPGGMLVAGIPAFRLPRGLIEYEIKRITDLGVEIETGVQLGEDISLDELETRGFKAAYLAIGAYEEIKLGVNGEQLPGVIGSLDFLKDAYSGSINKLEGRVVVIGGGNAAIDCARTALRLGPDEVTVVYRRSREEMPADDFEIKAAEEEGVKLHTLAAPVEVQGEKEVTGITCIETELGEPDESGRRRPVPVAGTEFTIDAATIITAVGQRPRTTAFTGGKEDIACDQGGRIMIDSETMQTNLPWVFAGGDAVTGPSAVIKAIQAGKKAAKAITRYLQGEDPRDPAPIPIPRMKVEESTAMSEDERASLQRPEMPSVEPSERVAGFELVELGISEETAIQEAHRCLRCDINR